MGRRVSPEVLHDCTGKDVRRSVHEALHPPGRPVRARVLHVIAKLNAGGATVCTLYQAAVTRLFGYPADVACGFQPDQEGDLYRLASDLGVRTLVFPTLRNGPKVQADISVVRALASLVPLAGYTVLHSHGWKGHMIAAALKRRAPYLKVLHQVHGWSWPAGGRDLRSRVLIATTRWAARYTDIFGLVTTQDIHKGIALGIGCRAQYRIVRSGIDPYGFPSATPESRRAARSLMGVPDTAEVVGTVGGLREQKNPLAFVRVAGQLRSRLRNLRAVWIGDGSLRTRVEREVDRLQLRDTVMFLGSRRDVPSLLPGFDVFLLTSRYEGMPRSVLEARAVGIPVVCTRTDGAIELASMDGVDEALQVRSIEELVPAVVHMFESRPPVRSWTPITVEDTVRGTVAAYEALVGGQTRHANHGPQQEWFVDSQDDQAQERVRQV